jgi:DNA-binding TFAR19-related protein (PDSD5 family)
MIENLTPAQMREIEEIKKSILNSILSREAAERLGRVRAVNPELAAQVELHLIQIYQSGRIKGIVTDAQMKDILKILSTKKNIRIKRL